MLSNVAPTFEHVEANDFVKMGHCCAIARWRAHIIPRCKHVASIKADAHAGLVADVLNDVGQLLEGVAHAAALHALVLLKPLLDPYAHLTYNVYLPIKRSKYS